MNPKISIAALIYRSRRFADSVHDSIHEYCRNMPRLDRNPVRFFFVANDPERQLVDHLHSRGYQFVVQNNWPRMSEAELFDQGYGAPEYISRVYRGWNRAIMESDEICVLVNSDHLFSPGWLEPLIEPLLADPHQIVCSQAVELPGFNGAWPIDFGRTPDTFRKDDFLALVAERRQPGVIRDSGVYMPCAFYRRMAIAAGLYPEGNLHDGRYDKIKRFGDDEFFGRMKRVHGCKHVTAMDSIVYHFREGEVSE